MLGIKLFSVLRVCATPPVSHGLFLLYLYVHSSKPKFAACTLLKSHQIDALLLPTLARAIAHCRRWMPCVTHMLLGWRHEMHCMRFPRWDSRRYFPRALRASVGHVGCCVRDGSRVTLRRSPVPLRCMMQGSVIHCRPTRRAVLAWGYVMHRLRVGCMRVAGLHITIAHGHGV